MSSSIVSVALLGDVPGDRPLGPASGDSPPCTMRPAPVLSEGTGEAEGETFPDVPWCTTPLSGILISGTYVGRPERQSTYNVVLE